MGFLLRCGPAGVAGFRVDQPGALTTLTRSAGGNGDAGAAGEQLLLVHGDLLDRGFALPPPATPADRLVTLAGGAFARHCGVLVGAGQAVLWSDHGALCPLHYARDAAGHLAVSTSAAALLPLLPGPVRLVSGPREPGRSGFAGIAAVPPGALVSLPLPHPAEPPATDTDTDALACGYFPLPGPAPTEAEPAVAAVGAAIAAAVASQLADATVAGALLSGGVDSSLVAALAARQLTAQRAGPLRTYTVGTPFGDEFAAARVLAQHIGSEHTELMFTPADLTGLLPRMVRLLETWDLTTLQIVASICFVLDRLRGRESVLLTGYGADLLFAGLGGAGSDEATEAAIRAGVLATGRSNEFSPAVAEHSRIAVRHPYWTAPMITTALSVPAGLKLRDGTVKWALRQAAAKVIPAEVAFRPKIAIQEGTAMHHMFAAVLGSEDPRVQADRLREWAAAVFAAPAAGTDPALPAEPAAAGGSQPDGSQPQTRQREEGTDARLVGVAS
jgi:carbapenam-3-carboxylate synthase